MKSLFSRFKGERDTKPPSRSNSSASHIKENKENLGAGAGTKSPSVHPKRSSTSTPKFHSTLESSSLAPLRSQTPIASQYGQSPSLSPGGNDVTQRPRSIHGTLREHDAPPMTGLWEEGRPRTISASGEPGPSEEKGGGGKKVTFRSPAPTPTASVVLDEAINLGVPDDEGGRGSYRIDGNGSGKRIASTSPTKRASTSNLNLTVPQPSSSRPTTSQSNHSTRPRLTSRQTSPFLPSLSIRPTALRKASMPPLSRPSSSSPTKSPMIMSPTPSDNSTGAASTRSYIAPPNSWSEMAEEDLIANLGPKERTRQEVLWEIVSSEERYVQDLIKLNDTFCRHLLPPSATSPHLDLYDPAYSFARAMSPASVTASPALSGNESFVNLPIAAKYATSVPPPIAGSTRQHGVEVRYPSNSSASTAPPVTPNEDQVSRESIFPPSTAARMNAYNILTNGRPTEPHRKSSFSSLSVSMKGRSHQSLPPPQRHTSGGATGQPASGESSRMSYHPGLPTHNKLHKAQSRVSSGGSINSIKDFKLPADLEKVLTVLSGGIMEGHLKLCAALKRRYEDQYPLVRSLADVFTSHSGILREYSTYVLHLERALAQVDEALSVWNDNLHPKTTSSRPKRVSRRLEETETGKLGRYLLSLEELAAERGEAGLVISLSRPFQRLLKYPLLFQNLLFNTDPSLREYEATLGMVDDVEGIVRQIEDEKCNEEEREKTRDIWARMEGLEKDKVIMTPKPNRVLITETLLPVPTGTHLKVQKEPTTVIKGKKSFKRLSDILKGGTEGSELWIVRFSDVSLLCEKTGITHLPISSFQQTSFGSDANHELKSKDKKYATMGKRSASMKARNLYRFVKVHEWHLKHKTGSTDALLNMNDISHARQRSSEFPQSSPASRPPTLPSIAGTPHAMPTRIPLKTTDGSPTKSIRSRRNVTPSLTLNGQRHDDDDTRSVTSETMSVMSFAFKGGDQVKPVIRTKAKGSPKISGPVSGSGSINGGGRIATGYYTAGKGRVTSAPGLQRITSGGHVAGQAANAKFGHRLRSPELDNPAHGGGRALSRAEATSEGDRERDRGRASASAATISASGSGVTSGSTAAAAKSRRSLPPSMTMSGGLKPLHTASSATYISNIANGNGSHTTDVGHGNNNGTTDRPAWNSGLSTASSNRRASSTTPSHNQSGSGGGNGSGSARLRSPGTSTTGPGRRVPIGRASMIAASAGTLNSAPKKTPTPGAAKPQVAAHGTNQPSAADSTLHRDADKDVLEHEHSHGGDGEQNGPESASEHAEGAPDAPSLRTMPSREDSVVGLWRVYGEGTGVGLGLGMGTPEKDEARDELLPPSTTTAPPKPGPGARVTAPAPAPASTTSTSVRRTVGVAPTAGATPTGSRVAARPNTNTTSARTNGAAPAPAPSTSSVRGRISSAGTTSASSPRSRVAASTTSSRVTASTASSRAGAAATPSVRSPGNAGTAAPSGTAGVAPGPATRTTPSTVSGTRTRIPSKASTVGRGGNVVSSRKRDLGGRM